MCSKDAIDSAAKQATAMGNPASEARIFDIRDGLDSCSPVPLAPFCLSASKIASPKILTNTPAAPIPFGNCLRSTQESTTVTTRFPVRSTEWTTGCTRTSTKKEHKLYSTKQVLEMASNAGSNRIANMLGCGSRAVVDAIANDMTPKGNPQMHVQANNVTFGTLSTSPAIWAITMLRTEFITFASKTITILRATCITLCGAARAVP
mmetsp:Transcript_15599/g.37507  ORF Transcript_15599/g.37507 Transcript_15599/m.37507 type:complete len:206 (-) Transcript_15599:1677-2294(-)